MEEDLSLAKYVGGLWAKDRILFLHPEAAPFISWMEPPPVEDHEIVLDIKGDGADEAP